MPSASKLSRSMSPRSSPVISERRRPPDANPSISIARSRRPRRSGPVAARSASSTSRVIGCADFGARLPALARRPLARAWATSGASNGEARFFMRWNARHEAMRRSSVAGAGQARPRRRPRAISASAARRAGSSAGRGGEVAGMIEHEAQRHRLRLGPGEVGRERGALPGGDVDQVALVGAQRIGRACRGHRARSARPRPRAKGQGGSVPAGRHSSGWALIRLHHASHFASLALGGASAWFTWPSGAPCSGHRGPPLRARRPAGRTRAARWIAPLDENLPH